jgi:hypothetical protein
MTNRPAASQTREKALPITRNSQEVVTSSTTVLPAFTVWEARRNQKRRLGRYLSLPVFACACGHHSLAHGGMGCEGVTDNGDACTCKRGAR